MLCRTVGQDYYFFPGGSSIVGESEEETLRREIKEEFNSGIMNLKILATIKNFTKDFKETINMFSGQFTNEDIYGQQKMKLADGSNIEAEWIPIDDIVSGSVQLLPKYDYLALMGSESK